MGIASGALGLKGSMFRIPVHYSRAPSGMANVSQMAAEFGGSRAAVCPDATRLGVASAPPIAGGGVAESAAFDANPPACGQPGHSQSGGAAFGKFATAAEPLARRQGGNSTRSCVSGAE